MKKLILPLALLLIVIGITKPDLSNLLPSFQKVCIEEDVIIEAPSKELQDACKPIITALQVNNDRKTDGKKLAKLTNNISILIELDGENQVIRNTEEIRQTNKLIGAMLKLDVKGKYPDLKNATENLVKSQIGDDVILLDENLRAKSVKTFQALAWAYNEGSK